MPGYIVAGKHDIRVIEHFHVPFAVRRRARDRACKAAFRNQYLAATNAPEIIAGVRLEKGSERKHFFAVVFKEDVDRTPICHVVDVQIHKANQGHVLGEDARAVFCRV